MRKFRDLFSVNVYAESGSGGGSNPVSNTPPGGTTSGPATGRDFTSDLWNDRARRGQ